MSADEAITMSLNKMRDELLRMITDLIPLSLDKMKEELLRTLTDLIPTIITQLVPVVAESIKTASVTFVQQQQQQQQQNQQVLTNRDPERVELQQQQQQGQQNQQQQQQQQYVPQPLTLQQQQFSVVPARDADNVNREFMQFRDRNSKFMNDMLKEREEALYWYTKSDYYFELFSCYLRESPPYIPRKFRKDKFAVRSANEYLEVKKFELQQFKSNTEITRMRRDDYRKELSQIDKRVEDFIQQQQMSASAKEKATERWREEVERDVHRQNQKWYDNIESTKAAHLRDREYLRNHLDSRFGDVLINSQPENVDESERVTLTIPAEKFPPGFLENDSGEEDIITVSIPHEKLHNNHIASLNDTGSGSSSNSNNGTGRTPSSVTAPVTPANNTASKNGGNPPLQTGAQVSGRTLRSSTSQKDN